MQLSNTQQDVSCGMKLCLPRPGKLFAAGLAAALAVVASDQYTKWLVFETVLRARGSAPSFSEWLSTMRPAGFEAATAGDYKTLTLLPVLNFVTVWNKGISFGLFDGDGAPPAVFVLLSAVICSALGFWAALLRRPLPSAAAALIIGGALGNVVDRLRFHAVADFIDFHLGDKHWPAFNLADSCIVSGACLLVLDSLLTRNGPGSGPAQQG
jgi:signal peptidase II